MTRFIASIRGALLVLAMVVPIAGAEIMAVRETDSIVIADNGNATMNAQIRFGTSEGYLKTKQMFPDPYVLMRDILGSNGTFEVSNAKVNYDDAGRALQINATLLGSAINKRDRWQVRMSKHTELLYTHNEKCILSTVAPLPGDAGILIVNTNLELPKGASNIRLDARGGILSFTLERELKTGAAQLEGDLRVKPRIMSTVHKIYGDPNFANGTYWVGKTVFSNKGAGDITNLKVKYKVGDYTPWSPAAEYSRVPAGGTIVDLYYPLFKKEVTELRSPTPVDLEVAWTYNDAAGKEHSDSSTRRISLLGLGQVEWSNLTDEERTGTWQDKFNNSPLIAAMVTGNDDVVRQFGGMVAQMCGGQPGGANNESAMAYCRAIFELQVANKMAYQYTHGFLTDYKGIAQDLKFPRDVLRDKSGTCVELAILYAALCQNVGIQCDVVCIPGHAFALINLPEGGLIPVECTGISGKAVGLKEDRPLTFDEAVAFALKNNMARVRNGPHIIVNVDQMQKAGVLCTDLPPAAADSVQKWGYVVPKKVGGGGGGGGVTGGGGGGGGGGVNPPPAALDMSGDYTGSYATVVQPQVPFAMSLRLVQQGDQITGEGTFAMSAADRAGVTAQGAVRGNLMVITVNVNVRGGGFQISMEGTYDNGTLSGRWARNDGQNAGTFSIRKR